VKALPTPCLHLTNPEPDPSEAAIGIHLNQRKMEYKDEILLKMNGLDSKV